MERSASLTTTAISLIALSGCMTVAGCRVGMSRPEAQHQAIAASEAQGRSTQRPKGSSPESVPYPFLLAEALDKPDDAPIDVPAETSHRGRGNTPTSIVDLSLFGDAGSSTELDAFEDDAENLRQISFSREGSDFDPVVSPNGRFIFFASTAHSPTSDIYMKRIDGAALTKLTQGPANDLSPAISPDGERIAFSSDRTGNFDLFIMGTEGGQAIQLTNDPAPELHPTWSPDGKHIAFCRLGHMSGRWEIWVTEAENSAVSRFLTYGLFPEWHPSRHRLLFQRSRERGDRYFSVWTVDLVDGEATSPTIVASSVTAAIINPRWSPDGQYIAASTVVEPFHANSNRRPFRADVWIMKSDGSSRANLTGGHFVNLMPAWGPDGTLYFVTDRNGRDNIWGRGTAQAILAAGGTPIGGMSGFRANAPTDSRE